MVYKITLMPGDYKWSTNGTHICDQNGFAIVCDTVTDVTFENTSNYCNTYNILSCERKDRCYCIGYSNVDLWVMENPEYILPTIKEGTFLIPHSSFSNIYIPKASQCRCHQVAAVTKEEIKTFNPPWKNKLKEKKETVTLDEDEYVYTTSNVSKIIYNNQLNRYILSNVEEKIPMFEIIDVYSESGELLFQQEIPKTQKIVIEREVLDDLGNIVMENELDISGAPILIPSVPEKYFDNVGNEITYQEYNNLNTSNVTTFKALQIKCSLVNSSSFM